MGAPLPAPAKDPGPRPVRGTQASGPFPAPRHACVPVDFEEVRVSAEAPEDDVHNAIMAIRRNGVALKGERGVLGDPPPPPAARGHPDLCVRPLPREHRDQPQPPAQPQVP